MISAFLQDPDLDPVAAVEERHANEAGNICCNVESSATGDVDDGHIEVSVTSTVAAPITFTFRIQLTSKKEPGVLKESVLVEKREDAQQELAREERGQKVAERMAPSDKDEKEAEAAANAELEAVTKVAGGEVEKRTADNGAALVDTEYNGEEKHAARATKIESQAISTSTPISDTPCDPAVGSSFSNKSLTDILKQVDVIQTHDFTASSPVLAFPPGSQEKFVQQTAVLDADDDAATIILSLDSVAAVDGVRGITRSGNIPTAISPSIASVEPAKESSINSKAGHVPQEGLSRKEFKEEKEIKNRKEKEVEQRQQNELEQEEVQQKERVEKGKNEAEVDDTSKPSEARNGAEAKATKKATEAANDGGNKDRETPLPAGNIKPQSTPEAISVPESKLDPCDLKSNLNHLLEKLSAENFDTISSQILQWADKSLAESDGHSLRLVMELILEKAMGNEDSCAIYARLCHKLRQDVNPKVQDPKMCGADGKPFCGGSLFREYLLNRCQAGFEKDDQQKADASASANEKTADDQLKQASRNAAVDAGKEVEKSKISARHHGEQATKQQDLNLIKFVGELFNVKMLSTRVTHACIVKLLANVIDPDEEDLQSLCQLLTTVGAKLEAQPKMSQQIGLYMQRMDDLRYSDQVSLRTRSIVQNVMELQRNKWQGLIAEGPTGAMTFDPTDA
ncbi:hypothetical protein QFC21_003966 [Naganishia friedmannii]|uniref:Uncharacterized protein n=1 Tax=Naganishia friedmannii TaxID=89922 RepID=A0ACC2VLC2_9TREE|nr:hypothetical protein QFC21_003966 [Naganishia friedmannii]